MRRMRPWLAAALIIGCGDDEGSGPVDGGTDVQMDGDDDDDAGWMPDNHIEDPEVISGGGAELGPINGELNVFVVEGGTDEPIEGAKVRVGAPDATDPLEGLTDSDGLIVFQDPSLVGPQVVTASADDYPASTWFGVNGAVITMNLDSPGEPDLPTATISGTIADWPPALTNGQSAFAFIWYSASESLFGPENEISQDLPQNLCVSFFPCEWTLQTRTGKLAVYALVVEIDDNGTPLDESDDVTYFLSYAIKGGYDLEEDDEVTDQELTLLPQEDLLTPDVVYDTPPGALPNVELVAQLKLGEDGSILLQNADEIEGIKIPALTGDLDSASYNVWALASDGAFGGPEAAVLAHDVDVTTQVDLGAWMDLPADIDATAGEYSFDPPEEASFYVITLSEVVGIEQDEDRWNVVVLDGTVPFTLPALAPDPIGGDMRMTVESFEVSALDPAGFRVNSLIDIFERMSKDAIEFTP